MNGATDPKLTGWGGNYGLFDFDDEDFDDYDDPPPMAVDEYLAEVVGDRWAYEVDAEDDL